METSVAVGGVAGHATLVGVTGADAAAAGAAASGAAAGAVT